MGERGQWLRPRNFLLRRNLPLYQYLWTHQIVPLKHYFQNGWIFVWYNARNVSFTGWRPRSKIRRCLHFCHHASPKSHDERTQHVLARRHLHPKLLLRFRLWKSTSKVGPEYSCLRPSRNLQRLKIWTSGTLLYLDYGSRICSISIHFRHNS